MARKINHNMPNSRLTMGPRATRQKLIDITAWRLTAEDF